ncbi:MAG: hypothetical protein HUJ61_06125 [Bacilli bacterium]|nr:hypothetical protein [Bacilli bacterium]
MKILNFFENIGIKFGQLFRIFFTIFAGVMTLEAFANLDSTYYETYFRLVVIMLLYGFPCFLLWSGLLGGKKTAGIIITLLVGYHTISKALGSFYIAKWNTTEGYLVYNLYSLTFDIGVIIGVGVGFMFICSLLFKHKIFKILGTAFGLTSTVLFIIVYVFVILMVCGVGSVDFKWQNILTNFDIIFVYPFLISAFWVGTNEETQDIKEIQE